MCYMCGLISEDKSKVIVHMKLEHNLKVEVDDRALRPLSQTLGCPLCQYTTTNMEQFKNHMITSHNKDAWNWGLEIKTINFCDECDLEFPDKATLKKHIQSGHIEVSLIIVEDTVMNQKPSEKKRDPKIRELPEIVKPLVEKDSEEYMVKGDGMCLISTTAVHIAGDENEAKQLARDLNTHLSNYRPIYAEKISADFPLTVTKGVQGEYKIFENSQDYFDWLQESEKAAFKWSSCVDVIAISNMTQLDIDIIIHEEGKVPILNSFKPDSNFPWKEDDTMKPTYKNENILGKMTVLNWKTRIST